PEGTLPFALEPLPDQFAGFTVVLEDLSRVVQFVGGRNQAHLLIGITQMQQVSFLAFTPGRLWVSIRVGAAFDHMSDPIAKPASYLLQQGFAAAIFDHVMQQAGNSKILVASGF